MNPGTCQGEAGFGPLSTTPRRAVARNVRDGAEDTNVERFLEDSRTIADRARGPLLTSVQTALSVLRNYRPSRAPKGLRLVDLIKKFDKQ